MYLANSNTTTTFFSTVGVFYSKIDIKMVTKRVVVYVERRQKNRALMPASISISSRVSSQDHHAD